MFTIAEIKQIGNNKPKICVLIDLILDFACILIIFFKAFVFILNGQIQWNVAGVIMSNNEVSSDLVVQCTARVFPLTAIVIKLTAILNGENDIVSFTIWNRILTTYTIWSFLIMVKQQDVMLNFIRHLIDVRFALNIQKECPTINELWIKQTIHSNRKMWTLNSNSSRRPICYRFQFLHCIFIFLNFHLHLTLNGCILHT